MDFRATVFRVPGVGCQLSKPIMTSMESTASHSPNAAVVIKSVYPPKNAIEGMTATPALRAGSSNFSSVWPALTCSAATSTFLASDFIHEHESGPLLKEAEQGGVRILWVPVRDSAYKQTALKNYQAVLDPNKPLATWPKAKRDQAWVKICEEIEKAVIAPNPQ